MKVSYKVISVYFALFLLGGGFQTLLDSPLCQMLGSGEEKCAMTCCEETCCKEETEGVSVSGYKKCCELRESLPDAGKFLATGPPSGTDNAPLRTLQIQLPDNISDAPKPCPDSQRFRRCVTIFELHILRI